jgi:hypothetical protein
MPYLGLTARSTAFQGCTTKLCNIKFKRWYLFFRGYVKADKKFVTNDPSLLLCTEIYRVELTCHAFFKL